MWLWLAFFLALTALLTLGMVRAISQHYRTPQRPHRDTPTTIDVAFEEIRFPTEGGKELYGWWIPALHSPEARVPTLVLVHGWQRNVERMLPFIHQLAPAGYNLLAFDARSHGSSDTDGHATMLKFAADIRAAIDEVLRRPGVMPHQVGILGLSVGGAAAIYAAAHDSRVRALVTIGAFAHPGDVMRQDLLRRGGPSFVVPAIFRYVESKVGARLDDIAPQRQITSVRAPMLLIHGEEDAVVPPEHGRRLDHAGGKWSTHWMVPGHGHSDCEHHPDFWPTVLDFFEGATVSKMSATHP